MNDHQRIAIERRIATAVIKDILGAGYHVTVNDGEEDVLKNSSLPSAILAAMFSTDEDYLFATGPTGVKYGWVRLIYGNDGYDVVSDYTTNLEDALKASTALADKLESQAS